MLNFTKYSQIQFCHMIWHQINPLIGVDVLWDFHLRCLHCLHQQHRYELKHKLNLMFDYFTSSVSHHLQAF